MDWRTSAPKVRIPTENTYSLEAMIILNTYRTLIQKEPEALLCLVGLSHILPGRRGVKTGSRPRAAHEVPLLTVTANRVIETEDSAVAIDSSRVPFTIERSPLDFSNENPSQQSTGPEDQEAAERIGILKALYPKLPEPKDRIVDFP
nr:hypothetical protein [Tanacetum cinerariifolium]